MIIVVLTNSNSFFGSDAVSRAGTMIATYSNNNNNNNNNNDNNNNVNNTNIPK